MTVKQPSRAIHRFSSRNFSIQSQHLSFSPIKGDQKSSTQISKLAQLNNSAGFTMIELLVTVAIIGILSAMALLNYQNMKNLALRAQAQAEIMSIVDAVEDYRANHSQGSGFGNGLMDDCEGEGNLNLTGTVNRTWVSCGYNWHTELDPWGFAYGLDGNGRGWESDAWGAQVCSGGPDGVILSFNRTVVGDDICYSFNNRTTNW